MSSDLGLSTSGASSSVALQQPELEVVGSGEVIGQTRDRTGARPAGGVGVGRTRAVEDGERGIEQSSQAAATRGQDLRVRVARACECPKSLPLVASAIQQV